MITYERLERRCKAQNKSNEWQCSNTAGQDGFCGTHRQMGDRVKLHPAPEEWTKVIVEDYSVPSTPLSEMQDEAIALPADNWLKVLVETQ